VASKTETRVPVSPTIVVVLMVAIAALGAFWYFASRSHAPESAKPTTAEAKEYTRNLKLSEVAMKATTSFAGGDLVEITGKIQNTGARAVERAELTCIFYDPYGTIVARERVPIIRRRLNPGETREFRLPFEGIGSAWNQAMPTMVIANIDFS
jgi:hypothetical protein